MGGDQSRSCHGRQSTWGYAAGRGDGQRCTTTADIGHTTIDVLHTDDQVGDVTGVA
jgi:hypothetical protein